MLNRLIILSLVILALIPMVLGSAAGQFKLDLEKHASKCFVDCNDQLGPNMRYKLDDGTVLIGDRSNIVRNCRSREYLALMPLCLIEVCTSAPAAAYAVEYGKHFCEKAGVDVNFVLPQTYVDAASEYFTSEAYTSRGVRGVRNWGLDDLFWIMAPLVGLAVL